MNSINWRIFAAKNRALADKIKVAAVSYLNTKPLLYGIERSAVMNEIELVESYPAQVAQNLANGIVDIALLPVAAIPGIPHTQIISDYGIAADGHVASVAIFSQVPMEEIKTVYLDYQSRTSVRLAQLLFEKHWKKNVEFKQAPENYIEYINGTTAGVIIGDRALKQLSNFEYVYDLAEGWKSFKGLPFVFAAWVSNKELSLEFIERFNAANALGLQPENIKKVVAENPFPYYDLEKYYTQDIHYFLSEEKKRGLAKFLSFISM